MADGPPAEHSLPQNVARRDGETASLYFDPTSGEARITYVPPNDLITQCTRDGHIQKVKYGTLSESTIVPPFRGHELT